MLLLFWCITLSTKSVLVSIGLSECSKDNSNKIAQQRLHLPLLPRLAAFSYSSVAVLKLVPSHLHPGLCRLLAVVEAAHHRPELYPPETRESVLTVPNYAVMVTPVISASTNSSRKIQHKIKQPSRRREADTPSESIALTPYRIHIPAHLLFPE